MIKRRPPFCPPLPIAIAALAILTSCTTGGLSVDRYALVYGVSLYNGSYPEGDSTHNNLTYSDDDAQDVSNLLVSEGWTEVRTRIRGSVAATSDPPTKTRLAADFSELAATIAKNAIVLLYFSGHGTQDFDGVSYIIPLGGVQPTDYSKWISPADLAAMLALLPTKNIIVVFDACNSGGFVESGTSIDTIPENYGPLDQGVTPSAYSAAMASFGDLLASNAKERGLASPIVISAAGSDEFSYDDWDHGNGAFTYYFLQAAAKGDSNRDGYVSTSEAYAFVCRALESNWNAENWNIPDSYLYQDFMPHISGGLRDLVLFGT